MKPSEQEKLAGAVAFRTTRWSLVLSAGQEGNPGSSNALEELCRAYWYPLYGFVRRRGNDAEAAKDLTQAFFAHILQKNLISVADQERGRFRTFLLAALNHFLINHREWETRAKRGGGYEIISIEAALAEQRLDLEPQSPALTPEQAFDRRWVERLLERVLERLQSESQEAGHESRFHQLKVYLVEDRVGSSFTEAAQSMGITEAALKGLVRRLRARYRELLRDEILQTVSSPHDVEMEIRHLLGSLRNS